MTVLAASQRVLVSIVTPTLDQARFISQTIDSVSSQDYQPIEYLIVDGGSRDGTVGILESHGARPRWLSAPGTGQAEAINRGWRECNGEILAWINSDDTYRPGAVQRAVAALDAHPEVDVVYGQCDYVDPEGRWLMPYPARPHDARRLLRTAVNDIPQPATFIRRRALERVGNLDETLEYGLDLDLWLRLGAAGCRFLYIPERLANLRLHREAKSLRGLAGFAPELVHIYSRLFERVDLPDDQRALRSRAMSNVHYRAAQCLFWSGRIAEGRRQVLQALRWKPWNLRSPVLYAAGGAVGIRLMQLWRGNPFHLGLG